MHLRLPSSKLGCLLLTYVLDWRRRQDLNPHGNALQACAYPFGHSVMFGVIAESCTQLHAFTERCLNYFGFNHHRMVPSEGLEPPSRSLRGWSLAR